MYKEFKEKIFQFLMKHAYKSKFAMFILMRPKLMFVDKETSREISWLWSSISKGIYARGNSKVDIFLKKTHVLEKGLQSFNREANHSVSVIDDVKSIVDTQDINREQVKYFEKIVKNYNFLQDDQELPDYSLNFEKYEFTEEDRQSIDKVLYSRRSVRWFDDCLPTDDVIKKIMQVAVWAPNSCNRQTIRIHYTTEKDKILECLKLNSGATAMNTPPLFITFCSDTSSYILPTERHVPYIDVSLSAQNVSLKAHVDGLASCILNWSHASVEEENKLRKLMNIHSDEIICFNMVMGYPKNRIDPPYKKSVDEYTRKIE